MMRVNCSRARLWPALGASAGARRTTMRPIIEKAKAISRTSPRP